MLMNFNLPAYWQDHTKEIMNPFTYNDIFMIINFVLLTFVNCALNVYTNDEREQLLSNVSYKIAPFGTVPYGKSITGAIYLPPIKEPDQKLDHLHFCNSSNINQYDSYFSYLPSKWVIARAGICSTT